MRLNAPVRLTPDARRQYPDIGTRHGHVLDAHATAVRVQWPGDRVSWHRREDLEEATHTEVADG